VSTSTPGKARQRSLPGPPVRAGGQSHAIDPFRELGRGGRAEGRPSGWLVHDPPRHLHVRTCVERRGSGHGGARGLRHRRAGTARPAPGPYPNDAGTFATPSSTSRFTRRFTSRSGSGQLAPTAAWIRPRRGLVRDTPRTRCTSPPFAALYGLHRDLTADPTTDRGWRRGLFRVPDRKAQCTVEIAFAPTPRHGRGLGVTPIINERRRHRPTRPLSAPVRDRELGRSPVPTTRTLSRGQAW
jgi:hypothetical protein